MTFAVGGAAALFSVTTSVQEVDLGVSGPDPLVCTVGRFRWSYVAVLDTFWTQTRRNGP
jgi:hypothetical protein